ncbi:hypothetical protein BB559_002190 [Furculomyces boomerangus]|uniref:Uncharacterized protein n=2 Tax=Harpellales TaxID=61421 RepID=A0A2T9YXA0_9FUNG|nr:hypothetical protein BB559_002190 [Furculomyces boomerangus]PVZ98258.1 hypothetical protein BB558_005740 [Smittium angustum]PWA02055.1 hypothetical protein BB558_001817 [Smittium angustum]
MSNPADAIKNIEKQVLRGEYTDLEIAALQNAQDKLRFYSVGGGVLGLVVGLYSVRKRGLLTRAIVGGFGTMFCYRMGTGIALFSSLKKFSTEPEYPNIKRAMMDIQQEIIRARGGNSGIPTMIPTRKPDFDNIPPPSSSRPNANSQNGEFGTDPWATTKDGRFDDKFGQEPITNEDPWERVRQRNLDSGDLPNTNSNPDTFKTKYD